MACIGVTTYQATYYVKYLTNLAVILGAEIYRAKKKSENRGVVHVPQRAAKPQNTKSEIRNKIKIKIRISNFQNITAEHCFWNLNI